MMPSSSKNLTGKGRVKGDYNKSGAFHNQVVYQILFWAFTFMKGKSPALYRTKFWLFRSSH